MEELGEGVMYFKELNVLEWSDCAPGEKNWREERKGERKVRREMEKCAIKEFKRKFEAKMVKMARG